MMKLSTSTNLLCERPDGKIIPTAIALREMHQAGFDTFDMSFYEWCWEGSPFYQDNWESWINEIAERASSLGSSFYQCHAYTYDFLNPSFSCGLKKEEQEKLVKRSIDCCKILGAKVIVTHPSMNPQLLDWRKDAKEKNLIYMHQLLEQADRSGMKVAVENMYSCDGHPEEKFFAMPEEIISFIDEFHDTRLGVCWDFEHGAIQNMDQGKIVTQIGNRLMATHVSDTVTQTFEPFMHVMPFTGTTDWRTIMSALKGISYNGAFSFEAHNFIKKLPDELVPTALKFGWEIGNYLVKL